MELTRVHILAGLLATLGAGLAAQSAWAQGATVTGTCTAHKDTEIRCAHTLTTQGQRTINPRLVLANVPSGASTQTTLWISECGSQGLQEGLFWATSSRTAIDFGPKTIGASFGPPRSYCVEVFLTSCRQGGPKTCTQLFPLNTVRLEIGLR